ncbi:MAG: hypothetical protein AMXMBFR33_63120 [Candidatus Xenobia bacterium]
MLRIVILFGVITLLEVYAFISYRNHPIVQPGWFSYLLSLIKLAMCWGGIEAARWLLRKSPIARRGAGNDWTRLWLWLGPPGGLLMCLACLLGWLAATLTPGRLAGPLVVAHAAAGALSWLIAAPWVLKEIFGSTSRTEKVVLWLGLLTHLSGMALYIWVYPGKALSPLSILGSLLFYYFILYHIMLSCLLLAGLFKVWKPQLAAPEEGE